MSKDQPPDKEPASANDVWEKLDDHARARVIELFAHLAYRRAAARHEPHAKEDEDVSSGRDSKDNPGTP